jgi:hypothetical protein
MFPVKVNGRLVWTAPVALALVLAAGVAGARGATCDVSCNADCTVCCSSWDVIALCGGSTVAFESTYPSGAEAERVAADLQASAKHCSGGDCAGVRFDCSGGAAALWAATCSAGASRSSPAAATQAQRRLIAGLLTAIAYVKPQLDALAARPDLKKSALRKLSKLTADLARYPAELEQIDAELVARGTHKAFQRRANATTSRAAEDVSSALALVRDRLAIDPKYAAKLQHEAEARAAAERAVEATEKARQAKLLAEAKADAARIAAQRAKQVARAAEMQDALAKASADHNIARQALIEANRRADAALLTAIKFLAQRNLSASGRSRADGLRAKLEAHKKELAKIFDELQQPARGGDAESVAAGADKLRVRASDALAHVKAESTELDRVIEDKHGVQ